jgi:PAS domain S-box-containing protein
LLNDYLKSTSTFWIVFQYSFFQKWFQNLKIMATDHNPPLRDLDEDAALRSILEGTATETGEKFFASLVQNLSRALNTHGAWVTEYIEASQRLKAIAFWLDGQWVDDYEYKIAGTPCAPVIEGSRLVHFPDRVVELFPQDPDLPQMGAVSYMGVPLLDVDGKILGHLAVLDTRPMPEEPRLFTLFKIFAARAAAELQRLRAESRVLEREEKLERLVNSAMDAIMELDQDLNVVLMNPAAEKVLRCPADQVVGKEFSLFLANDDRLKLKNLIKELDDRPEGQRHLWIPGGLNVRCTGSEVFPAEATLSRFEMQQETFYTLILRNVNERLKAEQKIRHLKFETEYLKEELKALHNFDEIIGNSTALKQVLQEVEQVADTDATVLILGESGTGKELIAHAIHNTSRRHNQPLIKVNCAAIPANLMESEFFGHEKGAFSGATQKRDGRFSLANGGTIFLDEIGELPYDLQVKLLRVLQEGEFEPVGSSQTQKVDVRVLAATNRDLDKAVHNKTFRVDLYYRLNVFPIEVPPLRSRGDDIALLASYFVNKFTRRMGRPFEPLTGDQITCLKKYDWPGNIRELQNVIERAAITHQNGRLNLDRMLPETAATPGTGNGYPVDNGSKRVRSAQEMLSLERQNLILALESTNWRVAGNNGAAKLLKIPPSTLSSRMKAFGIQRPR